MLIFALAMATPVASQVDLTASVSALLEGRLAERDVLLSGHGIVPPGRAEPVSGPVSHPTPVELSSGFLPKAAISDVRLGLMQLALAVGPAGQAEIYAALPAADAPALYLREGLATLDDLVSLSAEAGQPNALRREGDAFLAGTPIIVMAGAALVIREGETLVFSMGDGAFLLSFGSLSINRATVRSTVERPGDDPEGFRPFVASLGSGGLRVFESRFSGLGFSAAPVLAGVSVATAGLYRSSAPSAILHSQFSDLGGISVIGGDRVHIEGNRIVDSRRTAIWVAASDDATIFRNVVTGSEGPFAVRISGPSSGGAVRDNVLSGGVNAGLRLDSAAMQVDLSGNVVQEFHGEGVALLQDASCLWVRGNVIRDNGGNAIRASATADLVVTDNVMIGNGGAGLALTGGAEDTRTLVAGNAIAGNRAGIHSAISGHLQLSGNDLSDQLPRLLTGDLAQHTPLLLRVMRSGGTAALDIWRVTARPSDTPAGADAGARAFAECQSGEAD